MISFGAHGPMMRVNDVFVVGVDGGGSKVRVAVISADLTIHGQSEGGSANPNAAGSDAAMQTIQTCIRSAVNAAGIDPAQIQAAGIGVAGADMIHAREWVRQVIAGILPHARLAASSDYEIALVGAHGERRGVLLLAGTGSVAYGVNSAGDSMLVGGWGYLAGDEGGGYWLGMQALRSAIRHFDGRGPATTLTEALFERSSLRTRASIIAWLYGEHRISEVAAMAPIVLEHSAKGDPIARQIVETAARELALMARTIYHKLGMERLPLMFSGSLLTTHNTLSGLLCELLKLDALPIPRYPPVMGAALLALDLLQS